jgi:hypothetical protein
VARSSGRDRREHPRKPTDLYIQGTAEDGRFVGRMVARNLSLGGVYCTSTSDFPEMTRLAVRLMLPAAGSATEDQPVDVEAVVVRREELPPSQGQRRFELALYFTQVAPAARDLLERFLGQRSH